MAIISYTAHPTFQKFHRHPAEIKAVIGPVGSGSSTGCLFHAYRCAVTQPPDLNGVRRRRTFIGRETYSQLNTTVRQTIRRWFPKKILPLKGKGPIIGTFKAPHPDGKTTIHWELVLHSLESADEIDAKFRSFEVSDFFFNEFKYLPEEIITRGVMRFGRYPEIIRDDNGEILFGGCHNRQMIMDSNMPDDQSYWYNFFEEEHKHDPDVQLFLQPGALLYDGKGQLQENPEAENIGYLPGGYKYYWDIADKAPDSIDTDICNNWGTTASGRPVYSSNYYDDTVHYSNSIIEPNPRYPLVMGIDWGVRHAAVLIGQYIDSRLTILDEVITEEIGTKEQFEEYVIPLLNMKYPEYKKIAWADPAGRARDPWEGRPLYSYIHANYGILVRLANTSKIDVRIDAVKGLLRRPNGFVMSNNIRTLRRGFQGHYHYKRQRVGGSVVVYKLVPEKNKEGHSQDALQNMALGVSQPEIDFSLIRKNYLGPELVLV